MFISLKTTIEKWSVFGLTDDKVRLEQIECNHCVHLKILHIQMWVKSRSKHTLSWKCSIYSTSLQMYSYINYNKHYYDYLFNYCISFVNIITIKYFSYTSVNCNILTLMKTNTDQVEIYSNNRCCSYWRNASS